MPVMSFPKGTQAPNQVSDLYSPVPLEGAGAAMGGLMGAIGSGMGDIGEGASEAMSGLKRAFSGGADPIPEVNTAFPRLASQLAPKVGYQSISQPKVGGVLYDVLDRAAQNSAQGLENTPGSARLLDHYTKLIR